MVLAPKELVVPLGRKDNLKKVLEILKRITLIVKQTSQKKKLHIYKHL